MENTFFNVYSSLHILVRYIDIITNVKRLCYENTDTITEYSVLESESEVNICK